MPVILNKIDPVIVNNIQKQTAEGVVHTYNNIKIAKDKQENKDNRPSHKKTKDKVEKFNSLVETMDIDLYFKIEEDGVVAVDRRGNVIKKYNKDAIDELFIKMEDMIGVLLDTKK